MKQIFVDTSAWGALADKADKDHARALQYCTFCTNVPHYALFDKYAGFRHITIK